MCQAMWLLTFAFGNVIVIIIAESSFFESMVSKSVHVYILPIMLAWMIVYDYYVIPSHWHVLIELVSIQVIEFFFFAGLIFVVTIIFAIMSFFYKYVDLSDREDNPMSRDSAYDSNEYSVLLASGSRALK